MNNATPAERAPDPAVARAVHEAYQLGIDRGVYIGLSFAINQLQTVMPASTERGQLERSLGRRREEMRIKVEGQRPSK